MKENPKFTIAILTRVTRPDTDVMNDCLVAEPVPSWQRALWKYAFLGGIVKGKMKQMMGINAENVRSYSVVWLVFHTS
jgi:hypothetical protein